MLGLNERNGEGGNVPVCVCECLHARVCKGACVYIRESLLKGCLYVCVSERERERKKGGGIGDKQMAVDHGYPARARMSSIATFSKNLKIKKWMS